MSAEEFQTFAVDAVWLLDNYGGVNELRTPERVASAVCDTSDQLIRNLATLALNSRPVESARLILIRTTAFLLLGMPPRLPCSGDNLYGGREIRQPATVK